jgi:alpha-galactosidase
VLCNPEVIEIDQDPLGECARVIKCDEDTFLMVKQLADGSHALGLCNSGQFPATITATWKELGLAGDQQVRDVWRQKELGRFKTQFTAQVPRRGVVLVRSKDALPR